MTSEEIATSFKSVTDLSWTPSEHRLAAEFHDTAVFHGGYDPFLPSDSEAKSRLVELEKLSASLDSEYYGLNSGLQSEHLALLEQVDGDARFELTGSEASACLNNDRMAQLNEMSKDVRGDYYKGENSAALQAEHLNLIEAQFAQSNAFNAADAAQSGESQ